MRKNRKSSPLVSLGLCFFAATGRLLAAVGHLPVFFSDNHAETMVWIAETFDLDKGHALILIDAHSDASAVERSDDVREGLRRVSSPAERVERVRRWREGGRIQAFNWIEPLLPAPVSEVVWVCAESAEAVERQGFLEEAVGQIDNRIEFEARKAGAFGPRWKVEDIDGFEILPDPEQSVILTIDLDFFAGMERSEAQAAFGRIWRRALKFPRLAGVSFSVSRPWLKSDEESMRLFGMAFEAVRRLRGAEIRFEPFVPYGKDGSLKGREIGGRGAARPEFLPQHFPVDIRSALLCERRRIEVRAEREKWEQLLNAWSDELGGFEILADGAKMSTDGIYRVQAGKLPDLRIRTVGSGARTIDKVRWRVLKPSAEAFNLWQEDLGGKAFSRDAHPWVEETPREIAVTQDAALAEATWAKELDAATGWGRVRIEAEIESGDSCIRLPAVELRVGEGGGFRRALTEQFGVPYVFGIGVVNSQGNSGPETGWGSDCANFGISAWRSVGRLMRWGDPVQLRAQLASLGEKVTADSGLPLDAGDVEAGVAIIFGRHAAFLLEDRPPVGILDGGDLVAHHLGKVPEVVPLSSLVPHGPVFSVRTPAKLPVACRVAILGDVVLKDGVECLDASSGQAVRDADLAIANLEGLPAIGGPVSTSKRYDFSFLPREVERLRKMGIDVVGVANNHAEDTGDAGVLPAKEFLEKSGIKVAGAGATAGEVVNPVSVNCRGVPLAIFSVSAVEARTSRVAKLPENADRLREAIREAKGEGYAVIVLVHWGVEYSNKVEPDQRDWARWLAAAGADVIAGSHPHVVQMLDSYRGACIAYSLGNAVYPRALSGLASGAVLKLEFGKDAELLSARQIATSAGARD